MRRNDRYMAIEKIALEKEQSKEHEAKNKLLTEAYKGLKDNEGFMLVLDDLKRQFKYAQVVFNRDKALNNFNQGSQAAITYLFNRVTGRQS